MGAAPKPLSKRGSNSKIVPVSMNDLDDLEDMYQFDSKRKHLPAPPAPRPPQPVRQEPPTGLPPLGGGGSRARASHIINHGVRDDIDDELQDDVYSGTNAGRDLPGPSITSNVSPIRENSEFSQIRKMSADTREPPNGANANFQSNTMVEERAAGHQSQKGA